MQCCMPLQVVGICDRQLKVLLEEEDSTHARGCAIPHRGLLVESGKSVTIL